MPDDALLGLTASVGRLTADGPLFFGVEKITVGSIADDIEDPHANNALGEVGDEPKLHIMTGSQLLQIRF